MGSGGRGRGGTRRSARFPIPAPVPVPVVKEESRGSSASAGPSEEVVQLEDAVKMLVEHLVVPVLPLGLSHHVDPKQALSPEAQQTVARQVHATVLLYNYYHRKQFPQLEFATPSRFSACAALTVSNKNLLMYLNQLAQPRKRLGNQVGEGLSVTDKAIIDACEIAKALNPTKDAPEMSMWPITKVAVLLLHRRQKVCLLEHGSHTKGVWSLLEKDVASGMPAQGSTDDDESMALRSEPYVLQQIAYSEVELKTGMKRTDLRFIEEHRVYSLSNKGTSTMLFLLHYDQTVDSKLKEMPLDALVERGWPLDSQLISAPKKQKANSNSKSKKKTTTTGISTPENNKQIVKADGASGTNDYNTRQNIRDRITNCKRKFEALKTEVATFAEHGDGQSPTRDLQDSVQMDNRTENNSTSRNVPQDIILTPDFDPVINDHALKIQEEKVTEKSDRATGNIYVQRYMTLQLLQKMRDDTHRELYVLGDRSAEYETDIQTILTETEMTPKVRSILKKYENSCKMMEVTNPISSGEGCQTMNIKRKKLKEAILLIRNKCQELDDMCRKSNWILPRYRVLPSITGDMYQASIQLTGPDFNLSLDGDMKVTPHEARESAASNMLYRLQQKAREDEECSMSPQNP